MPQQRVRVSVMAVTLVLLSLVATVARADQIDDFVRARMQQFALPGVSLALVEEGKVTKIGSYGMADVAHGTPVVPETVFKIGSVSKQFIASAIMLLVQDGRLKVDDPVSRYLPDAPPAWQPLTIRHLLTHTGGLVRESPAFDPAKVQSDADVIKAAYPLPLRFEPGAKWEYSNVGYFTLAEIITRVSGRPWTQFMQERVFKPAGMMVTAPTNITPTLPNRALGYAGKDNQKPADDWIALRPSGAFLSTVGDLAKWDALLYTNKLLNEASRREMWTRARLNAGSTADYGFGWQVDTLKKNGRHVVSHGGSLPGFRAYFARYTDERVTVILLTNGEDVGLADVANGIADLYLADKRHPAQPTPARGNLRKHRSR
jgi:CubicO group peptidase (beta-lactamase class C family)